MEPTPVPVEVTIPETARAEEALLPDMAAIQEQMQREIAQVLPQLQRREPEPSREFDLEDLLSGRVLAWTGGLAILIGAIFFFSLAFSRGWIGPGARVVIGMSAAIFMLAAGGWFFERRERIFGHVLVATVSVS